MSSTDKLQIEISSMIAHVQSLPPNPTFEQLKSKVTNLATSLYFDSIHLPKRVQEIISLSFLNNLGWDFQNKKIKISSLFTFNNLKITLEEILENVKNWSPPIDPTAEELLDLSLACNKLWDLDVHRLIPGRDYEIDLGSGKNAYEKGDFAPNPFFKKMSAAVFLHPTFKAFVSLLDNYVAQVGIKEVVTAEELRENANFLNLIMDTAVMQFAHRYLVAKGKAPADRESFIKQLDKLWFGLYKRKVDGDSSGFEHVFLGEIKENNEVVGLHNWIQIYLQEKNGSFNYMGYIKPKRKGHSYHVPQSSEQLITMQFDWNGASKNVSTCLVGTSPEFEIALYTLCFYSGISENTVQLGPYKCLITTYTFPPNPHPNQQIYLGTSFPGEAPLEDHEAAVKIQSIHRQRLTIKNRNF